MLIIVLNKCNDAQPDFIINWREDNYRINASPLRSWTVHDFAVNFVPEQKSF